MRKPFFKQSHKCWYIKDQAGKLIRLDPDEETAFEIWRQMQSGRFTEGPLVTLKTLLAAFLKEFDHRRDEQKFSFTVKYLLQFCDKHGTKKVSDLTCSIVLEWVREKKVRVDQWSPRTQVDAIHALQSLFKWAKDEGKIVKNPIARIKMPTAKPRSDIVQQDHHVQLLQGAGPALRCYLIATRCSGARPRQIREVTAANVSADFTMWIFQDHKTRGKTNRPLVVYLPPCLQTLTKALVAKRPTGPLFLNSKGEPWKKDTVALAIRRIRRKLKLPESVIAYAYRHTFATESLVAGASLAETAQLLGHKDTRMVGEVYGHLDQFSSHMVVTAAKASQKRNRS
ncbi:MAG: tyrosine-type recombinase/integrase [Pirellulales bacterium]